MTEIITLTNTTEPMDVLCTSDISGGGIGDSGAGYIQQVNGRATVVAVFRGEATRYSDKGAPLKTQYLATVLVPEKATGPRYLPVKFIQDNIWPQYLNPYPSNV